MKKRVISSLFAAVFAVCGCFSLGSCNEEQNTDGDLLVGKVCLNDFETYKPDFQLIRVLNGFGTIDVNKDPQYVKSGEASAKVRPLGAYGSSSAPTAYVPLYSKTFGFDHRDLTRIRQVTAEVYNAEDREIPMTFGVVMEAVNTDMINKTNPQKYSLKPGWNTVSYNVDISIINILYDVTKAEGIYFGFESVGSRDIEDAPTLYIDDLYITYSATEAKIEDLLSFEENEVCNFDRIYQRYVAYVEAQNPAAEPEYSVVKAADYDVDATSGDYALRLKTKPGDGQGTYQMLVFPAGYMQASALTSVQPNEYDTTYFCFDLYACDAAMVFYPEFFDTGYGTCYNFWACDAGVDKWTTYRIKLSDLKESMIKTPGFFRLAWGEYDTDKGALSFLIDSFRIEKSA